MKSLLEFIDPYRQSFIYFRWNFWRLLVFAAAVCWATAHWDGALIKLCLQNIFVYFPNYLIHEFSHRFWGAFGIRWLALIAGNGGETLVPFILCLLSLRVSGGRYLLPPLLYWLATTLYDAGIYVSDARAMTLHLTSSDMVSNFGPGTPGDWYYILQPIGLLEYDVIIGKIFIFGGEFCLVLAAWSLWYYWTHMEQYTVPGIYH